MDDAGRDVLGALGLDDLRLVLFGIQQRGDRLLVGERSGFFGSLHGKRGGGDGNGCSRSGGGGQCFFSHDQSGKISGSSLGLLHADGAARPLAGAGVGFSALAADGQSLAVTNAAVAVDLLEAREVELQVAAQVAFDGDGVGLNDRDDGSDLLVAQFPGAGVRVDVRLAENPLRQSRPDAVDVREGSFDALLIGNINAE